MGAQLISLSLRHHILSSYFQQWRRIFVSLTGNFISGKEFLFVAIVDPRSFNSCYPSYYSRQSHFIRELDGKWDHLSTAYHCQQRRWPFNIGYMNYALLASIIIAVYIPPGTQKTGTIYLRSHRTVAALSSR